LRVPLTSELIPGAVLSFPSPPLVWKLPAMPLLGSSPVIVLSPVPALSPPPRESSFLNLSLVLKIPVFFFPFQGDVSVFHLMPLLLSVSRDSFQTDRRIIPPAFREELVVRSSFPRFPTSNDSFKPPNSVFFFEIFRLNFFFLSLRLLSQTPRPSDMHRLFLILESLFMENYLSSGPFQISP